VIVWFSALVMGLLLMAGISKSSKNELLIADYVPLWLTVMPFYKHKKTAQARLERFFYQ